MNIQPQPYSFHFSIAEHFSFFLGLPLLVIEPITLQVDSQNAAKVELFDRN